MMIFGSTIYYKFVLGHVFLQLKFYREASLVGYLAFRGEVCLNVGKHVFSHIE